MERHKINIFYTAPTAIRALMKFGETPVKKHNLSSLRVLGTVGEPINPSAWLWFHRVVGNSAIPIVDTYWQTETYERFFTLFCADFESEICQILAVVFLYLLFLAALL